MAEIPHSEFIQSIRLKCMNHTESDVEITAALPSGIQARLAQAQPARLKRSTALQEASTLVIRHNNHLFVFYGLRASLLGSPYAGIDILVIVRHFWPEFAGLMPVMCAVSLYTTHYYVGRLRLIIMFVIALSDRSMWCLKR